MKYIQFYIIFIHLNILFVIKQVRYIKEISEMSL